MQTIIDYLNEITEKENLTRPMVIQKIAKRYKKPETTLSTYVSSLLSVGVIECVSGIIKVIKKGK